MLDKKSDGASRELAAAYRTISLHIYQLAAALSLAILPYVRLSYFYVGMHVRGTPYREEYVFDSQDSQDYSLMSHFYLA